MDEPTSALDRDASARIEELVRSLNDGGLTVVLVTHDLDQSKRFEPCRFVGGRKHHRRGHAGRRHGGMARGADLVIDVALALILVVLAIIVSRVRRLGLEAELVISVVRAMVQLGAVAAIIQVVFNHLGLTGLFLVVMLVAAALTSARRLTGVPRGPWLAGATIGASSLIAMAVLFFTHVFPAEPRYLIPIGGMLIGNSMTAVSLAGSRLRDEILDKRLEIEARLALGVPARRSPPPLCAVRAP